MSTPWKTDRWFVSPWNYVDEVRANLSFPTQVKIHDVSLRDGEQQAGLVFTKEEKIRIAEKLAEAGVHRIEAGMPAVSRQDAEAIAEIARRNLGPEIFAFSRCMKDDVKRAVDCGVKGIVVEIPSSEHIIRYAYRWPLEKAVDLSVEATRFAKENGLYTVFFPIDASRAEMSWFLDLIEKVATEGHMDALVVVDTFGGISPHAVPYLVRKIKERIDKPLEVHFHDDFGMAVANTIMALAAGAEVAHTTVTSIGERAGNAAYEDLVVSLLTMYGVDTGINYPKLCEVSRLVREISGLQIPSNRPVVGEMLYNIESGIIASWFRNCGQEHVLELLPFHWDLVGQHPATVVLGKSSGIDSVRMWLEDLGIPVPGDQQLEAILYAVKERSLDKHGLLTREEFADIVRSVLGPSAVAGLADCLDGPTARGMGG
ncbi:MAG: pyruvate carboxyltransferase [Bacillota bacterium]|nr:pyruvate carboxyltransferase [Bacillota bacterium]MDI7249123.1 pyruvate carboxyltransferase [Bacillota bacterium]